MLACCLNYAERYPLLSPRSVTDQMGFEFWVGSNTSVLVRWCKQYGAQFCPYGAIRRVPQTAVFSTCGSLPGTAPLKPGANGETNGRI